MLTTPQETSDILNRIKAARGTEEPQEPTQDAEIVDVSDDTPIEEVETDEIIEEADDEIEDTDEIEESEADDDEEEYYLDLDGEEVPLSEVKKWKAGHMMQSDYTRKTTELSESKKEFEQQQQEFMQKQSALAEQVTTLEAIIAEDSLSAEDVQELKEYDPEAYIKHIEKQQKRKEILESAKSQVQSQPSFDVNAEREKLWNANPAWLDNGKPTKAFENDIKLMDDYAKKVGIHDTSSFNAAQMQMMLDAARYQNLNSKNAAVTKRVRKAPVSTKPKQVAKQGLVDKIDQAKAKFKKTQSEQDFATLRRLQRQLKN